MQTVNPETGEVWTEEENQLFAAWQQAQATAKAATLQERELRGLLVKRFFTADKREGTENYALPSGFKLKCEKKLSYKCVDANIDAALTKLEESGEQGKFISERLVKFKAELSVSEWKKLTPEQRAFFADAVVISDATPSLELVAPK